MHIDIASHIERLLFLHDTLVIPGFGGFTATRSPASADYAGGTVNPPSKTLSFNENLTVDDGVLVNDIAQTHHMGLDEARRAIQDFVDRTQALLNQREIVNLAGVGRLYKNYVQKIQFLPDAANFSADAYGLPPLQFSPIARSREVAEKPAEPAPAVTESVPVNPAAETPATPYTPPAYEPPVRRSSPLLVALIGALLLLASAAGAYWWLQKKKLAGELAKADTSMAEETTGQKSTTLENVAPPSAKPEKEPEPVAAKPSNDDAEAQLSAQKRMEEARKQAAQTSGRRCILIIATLQDETNVQKLMTKLRNNNLTPYHQVTKKGHQVGIEFRYTKEQEITDYSAVLQQLTGVEDIWVKQK